MSRIWFIHGTYSSSKELWTPDIKFCRRIAFFLNASYDINFDWGGGNGDTFRQAGAKKLAHLISKWHKSNPTEKIILVGHSHGGNVGILTANLLAQEKISISNLITISTPVREYRLKYENVKIHNNVYNLIDHIQVIGGDDALTITDAIKKKIWFELGIAGRKFPNANNIEIPLSAFKDHILQICTSSALPSIPAAYYMVKDHGIVIKKVDLWRKYVEWRLRK